MENLNVRKYYHSSQNVFYISTPRTVWRFELMCCCAMRSMLCRQWLTTEDYADNHNKMCTFVHQATLIREWFASGRVVGATITGALWGCLVSLQVGQESSSVYAMCPPSSSLTLFKYIKHSKHLHIEWVCKE